MTVDPSSDVVGPTRNIVSFKHFALASPFGVWQHPFSVDLRSIVPVALERNDSDWILQVMEHIAFIGVWRSGCKSEGGVVSQQVRIDVFSVGFGVMHTVVDT